MTKRQAKIQALEVITGALQAFDETDCYGNLSTKEKNEYQKILNQLRKRRDNLRLKHEPAK